MPPPQVSEEEIDDLVYYARIGDQRSFTAAADLLREREKCTLQEVVLFAKDEHSGNGVLHMAGANGHNDFIQQLCKAISTNDPRNPTLRALLNTQNKVGNTALHWAALCGELAVVKTFLEHGADPYITNDKGYDAIYEAELNDKNEVVDWILKMTSDGTEESAAGNDADVGQEEVEQEEGEMVGDVNHDSEKADNHGVRVLEKGLGQMNVQEESASEKIPDIMEEPGIKEAKIRV